MSLAQVMGESLLPGALGGGGIGLVALLISWPFRQTVTRFERSHSPSQLAGMRLSTGGFCVAFAGWLCAVFMSHSFGVVLIALGIGAGFVGMGMHWYAMFRGRDEA